MYKYTGVKPTTLHTYMEQHKYGRRFKLIYTVLTTLLFRSDISRIFDYINKVHLSWFKFTPLIT